MNFDTYVVVVYIIRGNFPVLIRSIRTLGKEGKDTHNELSKSKDKE